MIKSIFGDKPITIVEKDISKVLIQKQSKYEPSVDIFSSHKQPFLNWKMRALLLDWMIEVSSEFDLRRETFYLAYNYLDRYLDTVLNIEK